MAFFLVLTLLPGAIPGEASAPAGADLLDEVDLLDEEGPDRSMDSGSEAKSAACDLATIGAEVFYESPDDFTGTRDKFRTCDGKPRDC